MVSWLDVLVLLPQLNGPLGIAFQVDKGRNSFQAHQGKHFVHDLKDQGGLVKRETFGDPGFGQAIVADLFDVHESKNDM